MYACAHLRRGSEAALETQRVPRVVKSGEPTLVLQAEVIAYLLQLLLAVSHDVNVIDPEELERAALTNPAFESLHLGHCFESVRAHTPGHADSGVIRQTAVRALKGTRAGWQNARSCTYPRSSPLTCR
jgi:hypothetical protein